MPTPPDEQRCRATMKGGIVHGAYWSPLKRCGNYAVANGYCRLHEPPKQPAEDDRPESPGRVDVFRTGVPGRKPRVHVETQRGPG